MAFSTKHYYPKPIVPPITSGISLFGVRLSNFNARTALLVDEPFQFSTLFYYENDPEFTEDLNRFKHKLKKIRQEYIREYQMSFLIAYEADIKAVEKVLDKLKMTTLTKVISSERQRPSEDIATPKELNLWIKKTFKQRKKKIQSIYPKKEYFEFHSFLNLCNDFLKSLGEQSLELTGSLNLFFEIGSEIDWFLLNVMECSYHQSADFKNLFSSNVRVSNDLVSIVGALNILKQLGNIELYLAQEQSFIEKVDQYKKLFQELLLSGNRIIDLETMKEIQRDFPQLVKSSPVDISGTMVGTGDSPISSYTADYFTTNQKGKMVELITQTRNTPTTATTTVWRGVTRIGDNQLFYLDQLDSYVKAN